MKNKYKVVTSIKPDDVTPEMMSHYFVSLPDFENDGKPTEILVERNTLILSKVLSATKEKYKEFADANVSLCVYVPNGSMYSKVEIINGSGDDVITMTKSVTMNAQIARSRIHTIMAELFEHSDIKAFSFTALFDKEGITGSTLVSPFTELTSHEVTMLLNGITGNKDGVERDYQAQGVIKKSKDIIVPGDKGFTILK